MVVIAANARVRPARGVAAACRLHGATGAATACTRRSRRRRMSDSERPDIPVLVGPPLGRPRLKRLRLALILVRPVAARARLDGLRDDDGRRLRPARSSRTARSSSSAQNSRARPTSTASYLATLADQGRIIVPADDIALAMQHAIIAIEDQRFYQNDGVDLRGIGRALWQDIVERHARSRAARRSRSSSSRTRRRRRTGARCSRRCARRRSPTTSRASGPSRRSSREYLNSIYFGNGAYGIESAARTYFGQRRRPLRLRQARATAARSELQAARGGAAGRAWSPRRAPTTRSPTARRRRGGATSCCAKMLEQGYLTRAEYDGSTRAEPPADATIQPAAGAGGEQVRGRTSRPGCASRSSTASARASALLGGLRVQTTLDLGMQRARRGRGHAAGSATRRRARRRRSSRSTTTPARSARWSAARDYNAGAVQPRHAGPAPAGLGVQAVRPGDGAAPGDLAGLDLDLDASRSSRCPTASRSSPSTTTRTTTPGVSTLARATTFSDNAVYAQVGIKAGTKRDRPHGASGWASARRSRSNYAITLGGLQQGVTPLDMAHAYQTFATGGLRVTGHARRARSAARSASAGSTLRDDRKRVLRRNTREAHAASLPKDVADDDDAHPRVGRQGRHRRRSRSLGEVPRVGQDRHDRELRRRVVRRRDRQVTVAVWVGYPDGLRPMRTEYRGEPVAGGTFPAADLARLHGSVLQAEQDRIKRQCDARGAQAQAPRSARRQRVHRGGPARRTRPRRSPEPPAGAPTTTPAAPTARRRRRRRRADDDGDAPAGDGTRRDGRRAGTPDARSRRRPRRSRRPRRRPRRRRPAPGRALRRRAGAPPWPQRRDARRAPSSPRGHGRETLRLPAAQKRHGSSTARVMPIRGADDERRRAPRPGGGGPSAIGPPSSGVALRSRPMPSAWVSLPGPEQRSVARSRPRRSRMRSRPLERLERADQHRRADARGLDDDVQQRVDAVGAVDVGDARAPRTAATCAASARRRRGRPARSRGRPRSRRSRRCTRRG